MRRHYQSSDWTKKSLRSHIISNYSLLDSLLGRWRYKASRIRHDMMISDILSQRHQIRSRFL